MDYLQYIKCHFSSSLKFINKVLNLIINGLPSILYINREPNKNIKLSLF